MLTRTPSLLVTHLVLISQVLLALCGPALTLCQEADGGVTLEWSVSECCAAAPGSSAAGDRMVEQEDCAGCDDQLMERSQRTERHDLRPLPHGQPVQTLPPDLSRARDGRRPGPELRPRPGPPLAQLRTIVIRC